jgi:hypothetical protein
VRHLLKLVVAGAIVVGGSLMPAHAARTVTRDYVVGPGTLQLCFNEGGDLETVPSLGGSCFGVQPGETSVDVSVTDALDADVLVTIGIDLDGDGLTELTASECGAATLAIPDGAPSIYVYVGSAVPDIPGVLPNDSPPCTNLVSVTGVITANFI